MHRAVRQPQKEQETMDQTLMAEVERLKEFFDAVDKEREIAYDTARTLRRRSVKLVRDLQRQMDVDVEKELAECRVLAVQLSQTPNKFGFVEEALQEYAEAALTYSFLFGKPAPTQADLGCTERTYALGLSDAISELRRRILTLLRQDDIQGATAMFDLMDDYYHMILVFDHTDAVLPLRRKQDALRAVTERTRADITSIICQKRLEEKIPGFETRLDSEPEPEAGE
jgi:predicted translin family RNA/ssDNA-binding protein